MMPLLARFRGRHVAALVLAAAVIGIGVQQFGSWTAQLTSPNLCIRSFGPFFPLQPQSIRKDSLSAWPGTNRFVKVTGPETVSRFQYDQNGVVQKIDDLPGTYKAAAVTVLDANRIAIAYYDETTEGLKAYFRIFTTGGSGMNFDPGTPTFIADIPADFEPHVRFAVDTLGMGQFVLVTNIPDAQGTKSLRALVSGTNGSNNTLQPIGIASARPPSDTPHAMLDFDVAGIDFPDVNTTTFIVAFRGTAGLQYLRGSDYSSGVVFDDAYLKTVGANARNVDLASSYGKKIVTSYAEQLKTAITYTEDGKVYAGQITLAPYNDFDNFDDPFTSTNVGKSGDVILSNSVAWLDHQYFVVGYGVQQTQDGGRGGVYIRRGTAGTTTFGSELRVTPTAEPRWLAMVGNHTAPYRLIVSQRSTIDNETGLSVSYCTGCLGGVSDLGEQCVTPTTGGGGGDPICDPRFCGNDEMNPGEQCDDGNQQDGDSCDPLCRLNCDSDGDCPSGQCAGGTCTDLCGNGIVEPPTCVSEGGSMTCPPPVEGDIRMVNLPGDIFPLMHATGDLNKDGKTDVVVGNYMGTTPPPPDGSSRIYNGTLEAFLNNGDGTFSAGLPVGTFQWNDGGGDRGMDVFDADGDGDADVVVADAAERGLVLLRNTNMTFTRVPFAQGFYAFHLSHGDVNRDGDPELGIDGYGEHTTTFRPMLIGGPGVTFLNTATSVYGSDGSYGTQKFADMDGDGDADYVTQGSTVMVGEESFRVIRVFMSNGDGTFAAPTEMRAPGNYSVMLDLDVGDFNGDGKQDVVFVQNHNGIVVVFGDGAGGSSASAHIATPIGARFAVAADPSADGILDVVFMSGQGTEGRNIWYAKSNGDGTFEEPVRFVTVNPPPSGRPPLSYNSSYYNNYDLRAADYDGDGRLDLSVTHALSSDSATVILLRSSVASCTQVPPVLTCSQAEECDDGLDNGKPGKCTRRCTYCGNGVIDTVNGLPEQCDEGAQNGEEGSGCTMLCESTDVVIDPGHTECRNEQCVLVLGPGTNQCTSDEHCTATQHLGCSGVGSCTLVEGPGMNECATGADCCDPFDPSCTHKQCDFIGETCDTVGGPGLPQCSVNSSCEAFHFSCEGQQCAIQPGDGPNTCLSAADCSTEEKHLGCAGNQCVLLDGPGTNTCTNDDHCIRTQHLGCSGVGACTIVEGPGMDQCANSADCCDPADPSCTHKQCDFIGEVCEVADGPGVPQCSVNSSCEAFHFSCEGQQCAIQPGDGPNTCESAMDCAMECNGDNYCDASESCLCPDCAVEPRCRPCDDNNVCDADESCFCNDCQDSNACIPHLSCNAEQGLCEVILGPGTNTCGGDEHCDVTIDPSHMECRNMACTVVLGPGFDLCEVDGDCCDPTIDPTCKHRQCNPFTQSCIEVPGPSPDQCAGEDCTDRHAVCVGQTCSMVDGPGESECLTSTMCIGNLCTDGNLDPGEACDDGNTVDDDECSNQCQRRCTDDTECTCDETLGICVETCGNGVTDPGEACDEGENNRTTPPSNLALWYCQALSCTRSVCFDEVDNDNDGLDDEDDAGCWSYDVEGARTAANPRSFLGYLLGQANTLSPLPAQEFLAGKSNESCPAETVDKGDYCALTCEPGDICPTGDLCPQNGICPPTCGNHIIDIDLGEECDDQNFIDDDACSNTCRLPPCTGPDCPRCGDGSLQLQLGEQCDDGSETALCSANCRVKCDANSDCVGTCDLAAGMCVPPMCGDGVENQPWERCDDGDIDNEDACNNQCQPTCLRDADCESGRCDQPQQVCIPLCGNGNVDDGEQCDDGNKSNADSCTTQCLRVCSDDSSCDCDEEAGVCRPLCRNGRIDAGESCDDGNDEDRDQCSNRCQTRCRPGTMCPDSQACPQNGVCPVPGVCGDGLVNQADEQCDDGNAVDADACSASCRVRCSQNLECPSGLLCLGEECVECSNSLQCSDGFCVEGRCRQALPLCGNGVVEPGESCDDGNADDGDSCGVNCLFPVNHACASSAQCQTRLCDGGTCQPCGTTGQCASGLRCAEGNCLFGSLQCGDGVVQAGEACDDANFNEQDQCTTACLRPFGASCDHATQCASAICAGGACTPCRADAECSAGLRCAIGMCLSNAQMAMLPNVCGNGFLEEGESCDDGNAAYGDGCTPACTEGDMPLRSEVAANVTVQMPFVPGNGGGIGGVDGSEAGLHAGAGDGLSESGPAAVAVMAAGAAAGTAWVRRRKKMR